MPLRRVTIRPGVSTPADPVWSVFTQIGPRSDTEPEPVLTPGSTGESTVDRQDLWEAGDKNNYD